MAVEEALADLRSGRADAQFAALDALVGTKDERVQRAVVDLLRDDPDAAVRAAAAERLPDLATEIESAGAAMVEALTDADELVRAEAADGLGRLGYGSAAAALADLLSTESSAIVRAGAVESLGDLGQVSVVEPVAAAARADPDEAVRAFAAATLGLLGTPDTTLRDLLDHEGSPWVRAELTLARYRQDGVSANTIAAVLDDTDAEQASRVLNGCLDLAVRGETRFREPDVSTVTGALERLAERVPDVSGQADAVVEAWRRNG